jgi:transcriptional regulator with XRE-family HTH domain
VAREARGWTIEQLAAITKLNQNFIEALELGRWDLLPGRVYLKSFAKACAEALDIDVREVYEMIDGQQPDDKIRQNVVVPEQTAPTKKLDYKLPIVLGVVVLVIILIVVAVRSRKDDSAISDEQVIIPARGLFRRTEIKWDRPWERPAADPEFFASNRLTLWADSSDVWALVVADNDTVYKGAIPARSGKAFVADSSFRVSLSHTNNIAAYLNGARVSQIGVGSGRLNNLLIKVPPRDSLGNEIK